MNIKQKIMPLLLGGDINVYSMARAFYEAYGIKSTAFGKYQSTQCFNSDILDYRIMGKDNDKQEVFLQNVLNFASEYKDKTIIMLGCGDNYLELAAKNKDKFPKNVIAPYISYELMQTLIHKQKFYELCDKYGIDYPSTFVHSKNIGKNFELPFGAPYVVKPSNSVMYWECPFETQKKAYVAKTKEEMLSILDDIYNAGYTDTLIIQDFIPGDDTYMRVMTNYSDKNAKVKLMCLGHVLLEEHTPHGIGNHAVIINEQNKQLEEKLKKFLEEIKFTGFSNFDIKYDQRDGKYKVFEINVRQGRSNFYVTGAGYNLAKVIVEDLIENKELPFVSADNEMLWMVVPQKVAFTYIKPQEYKDKMKKLIKEGKVINPLFYSEDHNIKRTLKLLKAGLGHHVKFRKYMGDK